jgi:hypothetical protein
MLESLEEMIILFVYSNSAVRIMTGESGFDSWQEKRDFLFPQHPEPTLGPTQFPLQLSTWESFTGDKAAGV